jgi:hypothetical protein
MGTGTGMGTGTVFAPMGGFNRRGSMPELNPPTRGRGLMPCPNPPKPNPPKRDPPKRKLLERPPKPELDRPTMDRDTLRPLLACCAWSWPGSPARQSKTNTPALRDKNPRNMVRLLSERAKVVNQNRVGIFAARPPLEKTAWTSIPRWA